MWEPNEPSQVDDYKEEKYEEKQVEKYEGTKGGLLGELKQDLEDLKKPFAGYIEPEEVERVEDERNLDHARDNVA